MRPRYLRTLAVSAVVGVVGFVVGFPRRSHDAGVDAARGQSRVALLERTVLPVDGGEELRLPTLRSADDALFGAERFRGRWSILYFGYTSCPDVCPLTLSVLSRVARDAASGVADGSTQLVFVSIEPSGDTPARMREYLQAFDARLIGLTGTPESVTQFSEAIGAAARASATGIDHSTSLFVINPEGELAGVLLNPVDAARIVADFAGLRSQYVAPRRVASVR